MSLRRIDARFLLPRLPSTAVVLGDLDGWRAGLEQAGITGPEGREAPDLIVAGPDDAGRAVAARAAFVIVEGRGGDRAMRAAGYRVARWAPVRRVERPEMLLPLDEPVAARHAIRRWMVPDSRAKALRNRGIVALVNRGAWPRPAPVLSIGVADPAPPALLQKAKGLGVDGGAFFVSLGGSDDLARGVLHVFGPGSASPDWVLKFARVPGHVLPFDLDQRGLELARRLGGRVAEHAPRLVGRFRIEGLEASVESAARGELMVNFLKAPGPRGPKLAAVERVAGWIVDVGRQTAAPADTLEPERRRLRDEVVPAWGPYGAVPALVDELPPVPSVMRRGDLGSWNLVVDRASFTAVDWETAHEGGFPLWDLVYFLTDALAHVDGASHDDARDDYARALFKGEARSSSILFEWVRRAAGALDIPDRAVGPIVTLCWLSVGLAHVRRGAAARKFEPGARVAIPPAERVAELWLSDPALGPGWNRWKESR